MGRLPFFVLAVFTALLISGCRSGQTETAASEDARAPDTDRHRYALLDATGEVAVRLGAPSDDVERAFPMPSGARELPGAELPSGFSMWAWVERDGTREAPSETLIAYFRDGRLIELSHSVAPLSSERATRWAENYEKAFGEPVLDRQPARSSRTFGREQDACRLKLETIRSGADYRCTATLIDSEHVKAMQEALRAMREKARR